MGKATNKMLDDIDARADQEKMKRSVVTKPDAPGVRRSARHAAKVDTQIPGQKSYVTLSVEKNDLDVSTGVNEDVERSTTPREDSGKVNSLS